MDAADIITTKPDGSPIPDLGPDDWYEGAMISRCSADGSRVTVSSVDFQSARCGNEHRWMHTANQWADGTGSTGAGYSWRQTA